MQVRYLITMFILLASFHSKGQSTIGAKIGVGTSLLTSSLVAEDPDWTVQPAPSGNTGIYYNLRVKDKLLLGTELLYDQIEGKQKIEYDLIDISGETAGNNRVDLWYHMSYLTIPIYFGYTNEKFSSYIGVQASVLLASGGREKQKGSHKGEPIDLDLEYDELSVDNENYSLILGLAYKLKSKLSLTGSFVYGLSNILGDESLSWSWGIQQMTLGIKIALTGVPTPDEE